MKKNIELITLIYKSIDYLDLMVKQFKSDLVKLDGWDVGVRIVANDATKEVVDHLKKSGIEHTIYNNPDPNEYYVNRMYKAYNHSVETSKYDNVCLLNSDMVFSKDWLLNLLKHHDGINIPTARLVESGKMMSGTHGVSFNCGRSAKKIDFALWEKFSEHIKINEVHEKGLFMPCVFEKNRFIESGMYPEGNIYKDGIGTLHPHGVIQSGDDWYFRKLEKEYNMKHITVFDSLIYHVQEGEKDE